MATRKPSTKTKAKTGASTRAKTKAKTGASTRTKTKAKTTTAPKRTARGTRPRRWTKAQKEKAQEVTGLLRELHPDAHCALDHGNAFELTVATILSAQCTDERVNRVTPALFDRWPTPAALARADRREVEDAVHSTGFFRNKAKNIQGMSQRLVDAYDGEVPSGMEDLLTLAGVARKTANVVRGVIWNLADGVVVDTHVKRIAKRLGWTKHDHPEKVERDLMGLHPREDWVALSHLLILHGRGLCPARRPDCAACPIRPLCPAAPSNA